MRKVTLTIELEYDDEIMHGNDEDAEKWFFDEILTAKHGDLILHSNELGDSLGIITKLELSKVAHILPGKSTYCG